MNEAIDNKSKQRRILHLTETKFNRPFAQENPPKKPGYHEPDPVAPLPTLTPN